MKITPKNLMKKLPSIGTWSSLGLAETALEYYFPDKFDYDNDVEPTVMELVELTHKIGCETWQDVIIKYHKEVGFTEKRLNSSNVNEN